MQQQQSPTIDKTSALEDQIRELKAEIRELKAESQDIERGTYYTVRRVRRMLDVDCHTFQRIRHYSGVAPYTLAARKGDEKKTVHSDNHLVSHADFLLTRETADRMERAGYLTRLSKISALEEEQLRLVN